MKLTSRPPKDAENTPDLLRSGVVPGYAHIFWFQWSLWIMGMYDKHPQFMDKMMLALKYDMSFEDFEEMMK